MKKINSIVLFFVVFLSFSQDKLTFGVRAGATLPELSNFIDENYKKTTSVTPTFGVFVNLKLADKFSIQPEVLYTNYKYNLKGNEFYLTDINFDAHISTTYLTIPIFARYEIFKKLHLEAGPQLNFMLSNHGYGDVLPKNPFGGSSTVYHIDKSSLDELIAFFNEKGVDRITGTTTTFDYGLTGGLTYDLPIDGFSVSGRYYIGFTDLFKNVDENQGSVSSKNAAMNITVAYSF